MAQQDSNAGSTAGSSINHVRRVGWASFVFAVFTALVLSWTYRHWHHLPTTGPGRAVQLNTRIDLPRNATPSCDDIQAKAPGLAGVRLFVEGMDTGLQAVGCEDGGPTGTGTATTPSASFLLHHTLPNGLSPQADDAVWSTLLGRPLSSLPDGRPLHYDVRWVPEGATTPQHLAQGLAPMVLQIFQWWSPVALLLVLYVWGLLVYLAHYTLLIRDAASATTPLAQTTFSLSKAQMGWWFAIVFAAFVFLWLVTGEAPSISPQALGLLGISSATALAANGVAAGKACDQAEEGKFFVDLLSDSKGLAIHRFQMLVMTITLGLMFLFDVATKLTMPEFDPSLLAMMGLSAATYVGMKLPEQQAAAVAAAAAATGTAAAATPAPAPGGPQAGGSPASTG